MSKSSIDQIKDLMDSLSSEEQISLGLEAIANLEKERKKMDFQVKRQKEIQSINMRFLDKTVNDLETSNEKLISVNSQLASFVHIASHDLLSPLRSISSFSGLLKKITNDKLNESEKEYLNIIETSAISMAKLIDDLLIFVRVNAENLNISHTDCSGIIESVLELLNFDIDESKIEISYPTCQGVINCDEVKLKQLLQNLIANAIKFSSSSEQAKIDIKVLEEEDHWLFSVADNGIGIEKEFQDVIFEELKKLNGVTFEGTGMGLSICKKIAELHGGRIWVESELGKGSTFYFTIAKSLESS